MGETMGMVHLDARGLQCPLPVLKAKRVIGGMAPGQRLEVVTTDAASLRDFDAFTRKHGHLLVTGSESSGQYRFVIQKGARGNGVERGHAS